MSNLKFLQFATIHFLFSTTSTLSAGSTGSQARLIQSSHQPENYHPIQVEELGKDGNLKTVQAEVHVPQSTNKSKSPNRSPVRKHESLRRKDSTPNHSRKSSPNTRNKRSDSTSPKQPRKTDHSPKTPRKTDDTKSPKKNGCSGNRSPKKIKSSLKQPSRSLSIDNPTCVECYLSGKQEKG